MKNHHHIFLKPSPMKSIFSLLFLTFSFFFLTAQELPEIIPPSPTVANLMQFEEVPVSYYTGQPNISLPIYSKAVNANLNVDIALGYNTQGIKINNISSWSGTGWSLMAGGSISRTVRGEPDEANKEGHNKLGILHNPDYWNYDNLSSADKARFNYKVVGDNQDKFDNKPDLYQFNFMGYSGRFIILKEGANLVVKFINKSDQFDIQLIHDNNFRISAFKVTDTKGLIYTFDVVETSTTTPFTGVKSQGTGATFNVSASTTNLTFNVDSAWHLSKVEQANGNDLLTLSYQNVLENYVASAYRTTNRIINQGPGYQDLIGNSYNQTILEPAQTVAYQNITSVTKKLQSINFVRDNTQVQFDIDATYEHPETGGGVLKTISILHDGTLNKTYTLSYEETHDSTIAVGSGKRLWLMNLRETAGTEHNDYVLSYNRKEELPGFDRDDIRGDAWGYYSGINLQNTSYCGANPSYSESIIQTGLLRSIQYPTGGLKEFNFEHNSYSYYQNQLIPYEDYMENPRNTNTLPTSVFFDDYTYTNGQSNVIGLLILNSEQDISISTSMEASPYLYNHNIKIQNSNFQAYANLNESCVPIGRLSAGTYTLTLEYTSDLIADPYQIQGDIVVTKANGPVDTIKQEMIGGGVRIKSIIFRESASILDLPSGSSNTAKHIKFIYDDANNISLSSGVIDAKADRLERQYIKNTNRFLFGNIENVCHALIPQTVQYKVIEKAVNVELTQGSYVGYRHVKTLEEGNGYTTYSYTSPYEYPSDPLTFNYELPKPKANLDYKRGLLLEQKTFNEGNQILKEMNYLDANGQPNYEFEEDVLFRDRSVFKPNCEFMQFFTDWDFYINGNIQNQVPSVNGGNCSGFLTGQSPCGEFSLTAADFKSTWAKLKGTTTRAYFYKADGTQQMTETRQEFAYNPENYQISQQDTYFEESGADTHLQTQYYYSLGTNLGSNTSSIVQKLRNQNRINEVLETETYKDEVKLSTTATIYDYANFSQNPDQILPKTVKTAKHNDSLESRIEFVSYDIYNNPLEVKKTDGTPITYIWGYNSSLPVAKIENATLSEVANAIGLSEAALKTDGVQNLSILDNLRPALTNSMVSTYTYTLGVGLKTMTDPRGRTLTYTYDTFNRLDHVKDHEDYMVSKNEYNYRQN